jgi:hypothetical protein
MVLPVTVADVLTVNKRRQGATKRRKLHRGFFYFLCEAIIAKKLRIL